MKREVREKERKNEKERMTGNGIREEKLEEVKEKVKNKIREKERGNTKHTLSR